jgi:hypothetical protein
MKPRRTAIRLALGLSLGLAALLAAAAPAPAAISAEPTGPSVRVTTPQELMEAYRDLSARGPGGGTILLDPRFPAGGEIALRGGGANPVHITSADPETPSRVARIRLRRVDNLRLSRLHVDSSGLPREGFQPDIDIGRSARIEITGSIFTSNGSPVFHPDDPATILGARLSVIRGSEHITVTDNHIAGYEHGLMFMESRHIRVAGNDITAIQGDGIRLAGVEDVLVENNYLYDFSATPNEFTHSDFIQMWSRNAEIVSRDVTITGNVFDSGNGVSAQGIWIGNTQFNRGNTAHVYQNIAVTNNLIYSGNANGIGINAANNVLVEGNTLLWNPEALQFSERGNTSHFPRIRLEHVTGGAVIGNITPRILSDADDRLQDNRMISYDARDPFYVGRHFVNVVGGGDIGPEGWQLRPGSPLAGSGFSGWSR